MSQETSIQPIREAWTHQGTVDRYSVPESLAACFFLCPADSFSLPQFQYENILIPSQSDPFCVQEWVGQQCDSACISAFSVFVFAVGIPDGVVL